MKIPIRLSLILLCLAVLCLCAVSVALADDIASGSCGNGLTWTLDSEETLTVSGEGELVSSVQPASANGYPCRVFCLRTGLIVHRTRSVRGTPPPLSPPPNP